MRQLIACFVFVVSGFGSAAPVSYFSAVLNSDSLKYVITGESELVSITHAQAFRCPGCHEFLLAIRKHVETPQGDKIIESKRTATTKLNLQTQKISVTLSEAFDVN